MTFGVLTFSQDTFSGEGSTDVNITLSSLNTSHTIGNIQIVGTATVAISSYIGSNQTQLTTSFSTTPVTVSTLSVVNLSGFELTGTVNGTGLSFVGHATFTLDSVSGTFTFNPPDIAASAVIELSPFTILTTSFNTFESVTGNAVVTLDSVQLTGTLNGSGISFIGDGLVDLSSVSFPITTTFEPFTIVGNAILNLSSFVLASNTTTIKLVETVSANGYSRERTIYVPSRESNIKTKNIVNNYSRASYVSSRQNVIDTTVEIPKQNRTVIVPPRSHTITKRTAA